MFEFNNLVATGEYFLFITAELFALFVGVSFIVALLQEYISEETLRRFLARPSKWLGNILGAFFGALTPFCSCSTIPILVGLLNAGAPFGATMSFLIASPLLNPVGNISRRMCIGLEQSIESAWADFKNQLLNYIQTKVSDRYAAEDILQEVFIKVYNNFDNLNNLSSLRAWLYTIAHNTIIDYYRSNNAENIPLYEVTEELTDKTESINMNQEITACLKTLLSGLPNKYREPLELYILHNLKHREIAEKLKISISGSKTRVQRARDRLRHLLTSCCELEFDRHGNIIEYRQKKTCKCSDACL